VQSIPPWGVAALVYQATIFLTRAIIHRREPIALDAGLSHWWMHATVKVWLLFATDSSTHGPF
jgi:hypothetical protein